MPALRQRKFVLKKPAIDPTRASQLSSVFLRRKEREKKEKEKTQAGENGYTNGNGHAGVKEEPNHDGMEIDEKPKEDGVKEEKGKDDEEVSPAERVKALEEKLEDLQQQKHKLFLLLKQVLNEDEKRKQAERERKLAEQKKEEAIRLAAEREEKAKAEREGSATTPALNPSARSPSREGLVTSRDGAMSSAVRRDRMPENRIDNNRDRPVSSEANRMGDGRAGDGRYGDGRMSEGRVGEGRMGEGRAGDGRYNEGRAGDRDRGEGRMGDGRMGDNRLEGKSYPPHMAPGGSQSSQSYSHGRRGSNQYPSGIPQHSEPPRRTPGSPPPVPMSSMHSSHAGRYEGQSGSYGYSGQGGPPSNYMPTDYAQQNMMLNLGQVPGMMHHMLPAQLALQLQLQQLGMPRMSGQSHMPPYSHPMMGRPGLLNSPGGTSHHPPHSRGGDERRRGGGRGRMMGGGGGHW
eukprot:TRINITY_DN4430_c0_g1_i1.p1 TRINITY_DN4430_c0_g1~~TRINITY_DN4430_c0_g1_i1.p1  ORF type:complete len:459 (+),score=107.13 TRINITY_DN4430_c0_g1_i1:441-1817(+)